MTTTHYLILILCLSILLNTFILISWRQEAKMHTFYRDRSMRWRRKFVRTFLRTFNELPCNCDECRNQPVAGVTCGERSIHDMN